MIPTVLVTTGIMLTKQVPLWTAAILVPLSLVFLIGGCWSGEIPLSLSRGSKSC